MGKRTKKSYSVPRVGRTPDLLRKSHAHLPKPLKIRDDGSQGIEEGIEEFEDEHGDTVCESVREDGPSGTN